MTASQTLHPELLIFKQQLFPSTSGVKYLLSPPVTSGARPQSRIATCQIT